MRAVEGADKGVFLGSGKLEPRETRFKINKKME
jgi:hypothetical protein